MIGRPPTSRASERAPTGTPPGARQDGDGPDLDELFGEFRRHGRDAARDVRRLARVRLARLGLAARRGAAGVLAVVVGLVLLLVAASTAVVLTLQGVAAWIASTSDRAWVGPLFTGLAVLVLFAAIGGAVLQRWIHASADRVADELERDVHVPPRPPSEN